MFQRLTVFIIVILFASCEKNVQEQVTDGSSQSAITSSAESSDASSELATIKSNKEIASVNGEIITHASLVRYIRSMENQIQQHFGTLTTADKKLLEEKALQEIINEHLLYQASKKEGITLSKEEFDEELANIKKRFPSEEEFNTFSEEQNLPTDLKRSLLVEKFVKTKILTDIHIKDKDITDFYTENKAMFSSPTQYHASHILIKADTNAPDAPETKKALIKIKKAKQMLQEKPFSAVAKQMSQCPSAPQGGDLGYFPTGQMVSEFEEALKTLKPNQVSDIVTTPFGYHLIKLHDIKQSKVQSLADIKDKIKSLLILKESQKRLQEKLEQLKKTASIKIVNDK